MVKNILILSARGMGNVGDNLVSQIAQCIFEEVEKKITVRFGSIPYQREELEWADVVVLGGGGILYDSDPLNIANYLDPLVHARLMGKKTVLLGVGTQKITTDEGRRRYQEVLDGVDLLCVRDTTDVAVLKGECGVRAMVQPAADLGFLLPRYATPPSDEVAEVIEQIRQFKDGQPVTAVSLVSRLVSVPGPYANGGESGGHVKSLVEQLVRDQQKVIFFLQSEDDRRFYDSLELPVDSSLILTLQEPASSLGLMDIYREFDTVVTSRYHAFILAVLTRRKVALLTGKTLKINRIVTDFFPSLNPAVFYYDDIGDDAVRRQFIAKVNNGDVVSDDDANQAIIAANNNIQYLKSCFYNWQHHR